MLNKVLWKIIFIFFNLTTVVPLFVYQKKINPNNFPIIKDISYQNSEIKSLRNEVTRNMILASKNENIYLKWRLYKIKKKDQFFHIMAKTMQNPDTLSSINRLSSIWDLESGDIWWIPNMRGIAQYGNKKELANKYGVKIKNIIKIPFGNKFYFIMGITFKPNERAYFGLAVFDRPVKGIISSQYGIRKDPFSNKFRFHKGIDIACKINSKVWAAADGKVIATGYFSGYGKSIIIEHQNGYQSIYGHLNKIIIRKGHQAKKRELIAYSGNSGRSTGPHLHFEIRRKGKARRPKLIH